MVDFEKLNRQTREYNNRSVDRFNRSTKSNYNYFKANRLNSSTYYSNNNKYSNYYINK